MKLRTAARLRALIPALALAGCTGWQSAIDVHGASAISLKHLIVVIVATCSVVWSLVIVALIIALLRRREARESPMALDPRRQRRMTLAVGGAVAATVIVISAFTVSSFFTTRQLTAAGGDDLTIKVRGLQWWWGRVFRFEAGAAFRDRERDSYPGRTKCPRSARRSRRHPLILGAKSCGQTGSDSRPPK
jgi:heme/copper-type cytochrome/quinol oxidase subunit 2